MALLKADQKMIKLYEFCKQFTCVFVHLTSYLVHTVIIFCFLFVDITLSFTMSSYNVLESNGPAQPVLRLSQAVYCCFTISVWVYVEEIEARRKCTYSMYIILLLYVKILLYLVEQTKGSMRNISLLIANHVSVFISIVHKY